jgi:hypothetical protein
MTLIIQDKLLCHYYIFRENNDSMVSDENKGEIWGTSSTQNVHDSRRILSRSRIDRSWIVRAPQ